MASTSSTVASRGMVVLEWVVYAALVWAMRWPWRGLAINEMDTVPFARQWADPTWLPTDWYLGLDIPYRTPFNLLVGPVAAVWGLEAGAAAGRALTFALTAAALVALLRSLRINPWLALVPMGLYLQHQSLVADEWIVGAAEAKAFAYPFAIAAVAAAAQRRHAWMAGLLGAAVTFHVLIGLFAIMVVTTSVLTAWVLGRQRGDLPRPVDLLPFIITGAWGLWVVARTITEPADSVGGWAVYVRFRVRHHVMPQEWEQLHAVPWQLWLATTVIGCLIVLARATWAWRVLAATVLSGAGLFGVGLVLARQGRDGLLRYYWFRTADTWVPLATALVAAAALTWAARALDRRLALAAAVAASVLAGTWLAGEELTHRHEIDRSTERRLAATEEYRAMDWIDAHLPDDAVVAANPAQLAWYQEADRAAVALYKSSPQSAADVGTWASRLELLSGERVGSETEKGELVHGHRHLSAEDLRALARTGATHYLAPRSEAPDGTCELHREGRWAVFEISPGSASCR